MTKSEIERAIAKYYSSLAQMNVSGWLEVLDDEALIYDPVNKPPIKAAAESQKFFDLLSRFYQKFDIFPDTPFVVERQAAVKWTMQVTAKNNRSARAEGISTFAFSDRGKIVKIESYWDEAGLKNQLMP